MEEKKKFIEDMFNKGLLTNKDLLETELDQSLMDRIELERDLLVLNDDYIEVIIQQACLIDWYEIDRYKVDAEKERDKYSYREQLLKFKHSSLILQTVFNSRPSELSLLEKETDLNAQREKTIDQEIEISIEKNAVVSMVTPTSKLTEKAVEPNCIGIPNSIEITVSYKSSPSKYELTNFIDIFFSRYRFLEAILRNRQELTDVMSIIRLLSKKEKENAALIGLIADISETKNGNIILTIEDPTGEIKVFVSKNKQDLIQKAKELVLDEVVGIVGVSGDKILFAEEIIWPDIPSNSSFKKSEIEEYVVFLSDLHVGSCFFTKLEFDKFLQWINGNFGSEKQREIAQKVRYIIIAGDVVDGVGIHPNQEDLLEIVDINKQYEEFSNLLKQIPKGIQIVISPGNHDAVHLAEPQSSFDPKFASSLFGLSNVTLVTNPSYVNIGKTSTFYGFDILIYHGSSFDYYVAHVDSLRNNGGYHRADLIMKFLLKRRHLAPSFRSTPYFPAYKEDPLLIKKIPDFFVTGHIHYSNVANYKNVTMISGSCWQEKTPFQEKLGHDPEPARVPIVNLKTREVKILKFG